MEVPHFELLTFQLEIFTSEVHNMFTSPCGIQNPRHEVGATLLRVWETFGFFCAHKI